MKFSPLKFKTLLVGGCLIWAAFVLSVAQFSGFRADSAAAMNWPVALMLTPYGLIQNLLFGANAYLHKVYSQTPAPLSFAAPQDRWYWHYLQIYLQSNLLEVIPILFLWPRWRPMGQTALRVSAVNLFTHPIVFFGVMRLPFGYLTNILMAETFAVVTEALIYRRMGLRRPFLTSLFANLVSWQFAPVLTVYFFLWEKLG